MPFEGSLKVGCYYAVRSLFLDQATSEDFVPQNDGIFRPVEVVAPLGSIFNPRFPRACSARMAQIQRVIDGIIRALAPVMPEKATGGNSATVMSVSFSGFDRGRDQYWVCVEVNEGSYGGRAGKDGLDAVDNLMANTRNVPCEEIELTIPSGSSVTNCARRHPAPGGSVAAAAMSGMFVFSSTGSFRAMATARSKRPPACSVDAMGWAPASSSIRVGPTRPSGRRRYRAAVSAPAT